MIYTGKPELLAPAGSKGSLIAAIDAGADAVYFGTHKFQNRMRSESFSLGEAVNAVRMCSLLGVSSYITLNTRLHDREIDDALKIAGTLQAAGASGFIVADFGFGKLLKEHIPGIVLHGSTQMTCSNAAQASWLKDLGYSRVVCPRELSYDELMSFIRDSSVEVEMFLHGTLCVSISGQCLASWSFGGRSGNRGECACPCRLPYYVRGKECNPLSLKDLSLASHMDMILSSGVASLKIEGRQKDAAYVYSITSLYRKLIDEERNATEDELSTLTDVFSHGGYTDGYFTGVQKDMTGMRSSDLTSSKGYVPSELPVRKMSISASLELSPDKARLVLSVPKDGTVINGEAHTEKCYTADRIPADRASTYKNISKLGGTLFTLPEENYSFSSEGGCFIPNAELNDLRRKCIGIITGKLESSKTVDTRPAVTRNGNGCTKQLRTAEFVSSSQIPANAAGYFDVMFVPADELTSVRSILKSAGESCDKAGLSMPLFVTDPGSSDKILKGFSDSGGKYVLVHFPSDISAAKQYGLTVICSHRFNVFNKATCALLEDTGAEYMIASPEITARSVRSFAGSGYGAGAVVYGRLPVMTIRNDDVSGNIQRGLSDRKGNRPPVIEKDGITVIYNSSLIWSADRRSEYDDIYVKHYIFSDETPDMAGKVIRGYTDELPPPAGTAFRRML